MIRTVYVIHHSHTDMGYTHGQSRIIRWHAAFIRQAMAIARRHANFVWTCETLYPVEQFWQSASPAEREAFRALVQTGRMGLTAGYLNFSELPDAALLESLAGRTTRFAASLGASINAAMQADVNGCSLIQARVFANAGVRFLLTCVHPHHGYVPLGKRQELFRWDLGDGQELLVCHSDHYHTGNELGLAPGGECNYTAGFADVPTPFDEDVLERRLPAYLDKVQRAGWSHDWLVIEVSGLPTDNGPPSVAVVERINRWNERHGKDIRIEMTTPGRLAAQVARTTNLPVHKGDWPDWWADGAAGDPEAIALSKQAQRDRRWLSAVAATTPAARVDLDPLDQALALFAEHTFGHSASVSVPWNLLAHQLRLKKLGYAAEAADRAEAMIDQAGEALGGGPLSYEQPATFRVINPFDHTLCDLVELETDWSDPARWQLAGDLVVVRSDTRQPAPHQFAPSLRGRKMLVDVTVEPGRSVDFHVKRADPSAVGLDTRPMVPDFAKDVRTNPGSVLPSGIQNDQTEIEWSEHLGITRWIDRVTGRSLIVPSPAMAPFAIRASRLPTPKTGDAQCAARRKLGRNRNEADAEWQDSRFVRPLAYSAGEHADQVTLAYEMPGFELLQVKLSARKRQARVDVEVVMHKQGTWDAENVYLALPFTAGPADELWLDRGVPMRPGIDQLPGTLIDFYGVQDGLARCTADFGVAVAQKDSHLIQTGPLEHGVRDLAGEQPATGWPRQVYGWLMTNYWETNFSPELGGFYSFRFSVLWGKLLGDPHVALDACHDANMGLRAIRLSDSNH